MVSRNAFRALGVVVATATLAACSSSGPGTSFTKRAKEFFSESAYGPASPRVVHYGPVPKGGGRVVVGKTYTVAGKTYVPKANTRYSATGLASWYGAAFHGRLTANGEVYDVNGLTAAHPTLPLPSYVRVTNLENGRSMMVRVNDRGPFARNRIIDLSSRVADMLDVKDEGTARVQVDYIGPARMDGLDQRTLMASYRGPGSSAPGNSMFAAAKPKQTPPVVIAASAVPPPRVRPELATYPPPPAAQDPMVVVPAFAPSDDPLAPLILRSGFVNSYAADATLSPAQDAAADLAAARLPKPKDELRTALARAAAKKALLMGVAPAEVSSPSEGAIVQLGSFANPDNARRVAADFGRFGAVEQADIDTGGRTLTVVRVLTDTATAPAVIAAAAGVGLNGAFILDH